MIKIKVFKKQTKDGERFFLKYVYHLSGGRIKETEVKAEPRGWKTIKGALRFAGKLGYEVENADEYK